MKKCLACGAEGHRARECPTKGGAKRLPAKREEGPERSPDRPQLQPSNPKIAEMQTAVAEGIPSSSSSTITSSTGSSMPSSATNAGGTEGVQTTPGEPVWTLGNLMQAAQQVMMAKSAGERGDMKLKAVKVVELNATNIQGSSEPMALADTGATHPLRRPHSEEEWEQSAWVNVILAGGEQVKMKMNTAGTLLLGAEELSGDAASNAIVPVGELVKTLGYRLEWGPSSCHLVGPDGTIVRLSTKEGCPHISEARALELISKIERKKLDQFTTEARVQAMARTLDKSWFDYLSEACYGHSGQEDRAVSAAPFLKGIPEEALYGLAADVENEDGWEILKKLTFLNRRQRRRLWTSRSWVVHLFAGKKKKDVFSWLNDGDRVLLELDARSQAHNLLEDSLWRALSWAASQDRGNHRGATLQDLQPPSVQGAGANASAISSRTVRLADAVGRGENASDTGHQAVCAHALASCKIDSGKAAEPWSEDVNVDGGVCH